MSITERAAGAREAAQRWHEKARRALQSGDRARARKFVALARLNRRHAQRLADG